MGDSLPRELMELDFELHETDLEMLVAGPADDQYNDLLDREVLQHLGLFGTAADTSGGGSGAGSSGSGSAPPPAQQLLSLFSIITEADVAAAAGAVDGDAAGGSGGSLPAQQPPSFMSGGGGSPGGNIATQVANLLSGTHPSARGANLADWLAGNTPVVSLPDDAAPAPGTRPMLTLQPAAALSLPGLIPAVATPPPLTQLPAAVPRTGTGLPLDQQLQLQAETGAAGAAGQQQPTVAQLPAAAYTAGLPAWQPHVGMQQQQQQQQATQLQQQAAQQQQQQVPIALPVLPEGAPLPLLASLDEEGEEEPTFSGGSAGSAGGGSATKPSNKKFSNRQLTRISAIEAELQKLQREMQAVKLENQRLKDKNLEVERQLCAQGQLQQLAAAVSAATAHAAPPLAAAAATSPPNSQRKLLMHLNISARPPDAEMLKVAALTWPKLQDWARQLHARCSEVVAGSPPLGCVEAEQAAKTALRAGHYWDLLVLICRPDLTARMLSEDLSAPPAPVPPAPGAAPPPGADAWPAAALGALELGEEQRGALAEAWRAHCGAAAQRAQRRQELLDAIRSGFLQPLQRGRPEDLELGKPLARQGMEAMEVLRQVVRQDQAAGVQVAAGLRKLLSPLQAARLFVAAWPFYPDPSKWAPLLLGEPRAVAA